MNFRIGPFIKLDTVQGEPVPVAGRRLIPVARVLTVSLGRRGMPAAGGIVWARPIAVEITGAQGTQRLAIPSPRIRLILSMIAALGLLGLLGFRSRLAVRHNDSEMKESALRPSLLSPHG